MQNDQLYTKLKCPIWQYTLIELNYEIPTVWELGRVEILPSSSKLFLATRERGGYHVEIPLRLNRDATGKPLSRFPPYRKDVSRTFRRHPTQNSRAVGSPVKWGCGNAVEEGKEAVGQSGMYELPRR